MGGGGHPFWKFHQGPTLLQQGELNPTENRRQEIELLCLLSLRGQTASCTYEALWWSAFGPQLPWAVGSGGVLPDPISRLFLNSRRLLQILLGENTRHGV